MTRKFLTVTAVSSSIAAVLKANGFEEKIIQRAVSQVAAVTHVPTVGHNFATNAPQPIIPHQVAGPAPSAHGYAIPAQNFPSAAVFEAIVTPPSSKGKGAAKKPRATAPKAAKVPTAPKSKAPSKRKNKDGYTPSKGYTCHVCTAENRWKKQTPMDITGLMAHAREKHSIPEDQLEDYCKSYQPY